MGSAHSTADGPQQAPIDAFATAPAAEPRTLTDAPRLQHLMALPTTDTAPAAPRQGWSPPSRRVGAVLVVANEEEDGIGEAACAVQPPAVGDGGDGGVRLDDDDDLLFDAGRLASFDEDEEGAPHSTEVSCSRASTSAAGPAWSQAARDQASLTRDFSSKQRFVVLHKDADGRVGLRITGPASTPTSTATSTPTSTATATATDGCFVTEIVPDSPAHHTGLLKRGQRLLAIDGRDVTTATRDECVACIQAAGASVTFRVEYHPAGFAAYDAGRELRRATLAAFNASAGTLACESSTDSPPTGKRRAGGRRRSSTAASSTSAQPLAPLPPPPPSTPSPAELVGLVGARGKPLTVTYFGAAPLASAKPADIQAAYTQLLAAGKPGRRVDSEGKAAAGGKRQRSRSSPRLRRRRSTSPTVTPTAQLTALAPYRLLAGTKMQPKVSASRLVFEAMRGAKRKRSSRHHDKENCSRAGAAAAAQPRLVWSLLDILNCQASGAFLALVCFQQLGPPGSDPTMVCHFFRSRTSKSIESLHMAIVARCEAGFDKLRQTVPLPNYERRRRELDGLAHTTPPSLL